MVLENLALRQRKDCKQGKRTGKYPMDFGLRQAGLDRFIVWRSIYPAGVHGDYWLDGH